MPVTLSFEFDKTNIKANKNGEENEKRIGEDYNRIRCFFEKLGWEHLGGSSYHYPRLLVDTSKQGTEDWFNQVIPALMLFRTMVVRMDYKLEKFTLDVQSSTGFSEKKESKPEYGHRIIDFKDLEFEKSHDAFNTETLIKWVDEIKYPYGKKWQK